MVQARDFEDDAEARLRDELRVSIDIEGGVAGNKDSKMIAVRQGKVSCGEEDVCATRADGRNNGKRW